MALDSPEMIFKDNREGAQIYLNELIDAIKEKED